MPVFVLTHHKRPTLAMEGDNVFPFVSDSIEMVLGQAKEAAKGKDVRIGGEARLIDEMHLAQSPVLLGRGENLLAGLDLQALGYVCTDHVATPAATHLIIKKHG